MEKPRPLRPPGARPRLLFCEVVIMYLYPLLLVCCPPRVYPGTCVCVCVPPPVARASCLPRRKPGARDPPHPSRLRYTPEKKSNYLQIICKLYANYMQIDQLYVLVDYLHIICTFFRECTCPPSPCRPLRITCRTLRTSPPPCAFSPQSPPPAERHLVTVVIKHLYF